VRNTDRWLSVTEASEVLGMSPSGVRGLIRTERIKAVQHVPGGKYRIRESECERYLAEIETGTAAPQSERAPAAA